MKKCLPDSLSVRSEVVGEHAVEHEDRIDTIARDLVAMWQHETGEIGSTNAIFNNADYEVTKMERNAATSLGSSLDETNRIKVPGKRLALEH